MNTQSVTQEYLMGIREGRQALRTYGMGVAHAHLDNLNRTIKNFDASSPVGQMLRGERDFWRKQIKNA